MAIMHFSHISNFQKIIHFLADHLTSSQLLNKHYIMCHLYSFVHLIPINFVHQNLGLFKTWKKFGVLFGSLMEIKNMI